MASPSKLNMFIIREWTIQEQMDFSGTNGSKPEHLLHMER